MSSWKDWQGCIPFVGAIIERTNEDGILELLVQTRWKPKYESIYNGTLEFAAGVLDKPYESVYDAIAREINEETGLKLKKFINQDKTEILSPQKIDGAFGFRPYCCTQQIKDGNPWVGFIFRCEVEPGETKSQEGETQDVKWVNAREFFEIYTKTPEKLFTLELPAWEYYFKECGWI